MQGSESRVSQEARQVLQLAQQAATLANRPLGSAELLKAFYEADNEAQHYLREHHVEPDRLFSGPRPEGVEPEEVMLAIWQTAEALALHEQDATMTPLHLLAGLLRYHANSQAVALLRQAQYDTTRLRNTLISHLTRSRMEAQIPPLAMEQTLAAAPHPAGHAAAAWGQPQGPAVEVPQHGWEVPEEAHPLLAPNPYLAPLPPPEPPPGPAVALMPPPVPAPMPSLPAQPPRRPVVRKAQRPRSSSSRLLRGPGAASPAVRQQGKPSERRPEEKDAEPGELAQKLKGRFGSRRPKNRQDKLAPPSMQELARELFAEGEPERPTPEPEGEAGARRGRRAAPEVIEAQKERAEVQRARNSGAAAAPPRLMPQKLSRAQQRRLEEVYTLSDKKYPNLVKLGRNLSLEALHGKFDGLIGRDTEVSQLIDILNKRRSNNPLLVGPPGVGKTAIVEGLALALLGDQGKSSGLGERVLVELEIGRLLSGTQLRGSFAERLGQLKDEVVKAEGRVVVFLDEIHTWIGAGASGDGGADAAGELKAALARGKFPCVGATTLDEYKRFIEADPAFRRRFQVVDVDEPTEEVALEILRGLVKAYEEHHGVRYSDDALHAAVQFSQRYIPEQKLPDKAIGLVDLAGSRARRAEDKRVSRGVVAAVVSDQTGVPVDKLMMRDKERFLRMEENLSASLIGHRHVIRRVSQVIRRNYAGFQSGRPIGSFLFLGPTGVGKTEMVKVLADFLFRDRNAIVRLDMSEFRELHAVSRLIGAPPGYVGYEQGGQLTEAVRRRPYQIVLLDEVEKAHPEVLNVLLQLLDEGRLTDGRGRTVDFSNTVVIMTSNLGGKALTEGVEALHRGRIGFGPLAIAPASVALGEEAQGEVLGVARAALSPELWNRIEERLVFGPLSRAEVMDIARLQFKDSARRLAAERDVYMEADDSLYPFLVDNGGYDPQLGARPMRQTLQRLVEARVSEMILQGEVEPGDHVYIRVQANQAIVEVTDS